MCIRDRKSDLGCQNTPFQGNDDPVVFRWAASFTAQKTAAVAAALAVIINHFFARPACDIVVDQRDQILDHITINH